MMKCYVVLLLISIYTSKISSAGNTSDSSTTNPPRTLPLMLMTFKYLIYIPTSLKDPSWIENGQILGGGTRFHDVVTDNTEYMCAIDDLGKLDNADSQIQYCSYPTTFRESEPLTCAYDPEPVASKMVEEKQADSPDAPRCGPGNRHKMYWFGYEVCFTENPIRNEEIRQSNVLLLRDNPITVRNEFIVYRFCYDEDAKETLYTRHAIMSPKLLEDDRLNPERQRPHDMMTNGYKLFGSHYETIKEAYSKMKNGIENAQQMVPADDMAMATWRKPTHHFLNLKLMEDKHKDLWNYINELIRSSAIKDDKRYLIYTRTYTAPERQRSTNLPEGLQQPDIWLKVVDHYYIDSNTLKVTFAGVAIILNNNPGNQFADNFFENTCNGDLCKNAFSKKFPKVGEFVRCCPVNEKIKNLFDARLIVHNTLKPDFLIESIEYDHKEGEVRS